MNYLYRGCLMVGMLFTMCISYSQSNGGTSDSCAEISLNLKTLVPEITPGEFAQPQGFVDENAPWLHVVEPIYNETDKNSVKKAKKKRLMFKRRFYFELSQDKEFKDKVFSSGPKRWSFYNPYRHLEKGTWYWRYGVADPETPDKPVWNKRVFSFVITGNEYKTPIPPSPETFLDSVMKKDAPMFTMFREELGHLLPEKSWKEMADWLKEYADKQYRISQDMSFTVSEEDAVKAGKVDKNGKPNAKEVFYRQKMNSRMIGKSRYISNLMSAYMLTGDGKFRDIAIQKTHEQMEFFENAKFEIPSLGKTYVLKDEVWTGKPYSLANFIQICPEVLTDDEIKSIVNEFYPEDWTCPNDFESAEHSVYDQHLWQEIMDKFKRPMSFVRYSEKAREELKWAYELWLFRAPALGRNDGGSLEGDGYLGVHDSYLGVIPWVIYKLTGFNYIKSNRWYKNHAKYLVYTNPFGKSGNGYCDGDGNGASMPYSVEVMAYMDPENYWNKLRYKMQPQWDVKKFVADLGKGDKAYALLSLWNKMKAPEVSEIKAPDELAAIFKDVGEVSMHTNLTDESKNLQVTLHSSPYGSLMHTHPAQNAFNLAYGGQDLFWKTGFYNGGQWHNLLSYKSSRAHNTILADGMTQGFARSAYGWIPRFVSGEKISYAVGDASNAYNGENRYISPKWRDKETGEYLVGNIIPCRPEYGFGNPGVKKFRRHLLMLRPDYVLIYDELESQKPISWEFRLHSRRWMCDLGNNTLMGCNDFGAATVKMFSGVDIATSLKSDYLKNEEDGINQLTDIKPEDAWLMRPIDDENKHKNGFAKHYHGAFTTIEKHQNIRFLAVIQMHPGKDRSFKPKNQINVTGEGLMKIDLDGYVVEAQLDGNKPAMLHVVDKEGKAAFITGKDTDKLSFMGRTYKSKVKGSSILVEKSISNGEIFEEAVDTLPDMLLYGNLY